MITHCIIISVLLFIFTNAKADTTEVIIIGTTHNETENFNPDSLYNIFLKLQPHVILMESDSTYMTYDYRLKDHIKDIANETRAVTLYLESNNVHLRPYDITNRDNYLNSFRRRRMERSFFEKLTELYESGNMSSNASSIINGLINSMDYAEYLSYNTPFEINRPENDTLIKEINYYEFEAFHQLINETPELYEYGEYWQEHTNFWVMRNNAMVENIIRYAREFSGKRLIVLCGFSHKPYLQDGLKELVLNGEIIIKEYWE